MKIDVPCVPPSLNKSLRTHWSKRPAQKLMWMNALYLLTFEERRQLSKWAAEKRKMRVTITLFHSRLYDRDNSFGACKAIFDAMKEAGFLADDRPEFLEQVVEQQKCSHRTRHTTIEVELA